MTATIVTQLRRAVWPGSGGHAAPDVQLIVFPELEQEAGGEVRYNTSILLDRSSQIVAKYRKVHLPGHKEHEPWRRFQHLEKRYFTPGPGWGVTQAVGGHHGHGPATTGAGPRPTA